MVFQKVHYVTSISTNNISRNKLIALSNVYNITQKKLLAKLTDKEVKQLSSKDKHNFICILKATNVKDNLKHTQRKLIKMTKKISNIGVDNAVKSKIKALALVNGNKTICGYIEWLIDQQVRHLSSGEYEDYHRFFYYFEKNNIQNH